MIKWNDKGVLRDLRDYVADLNAANPNIRVLLYQNVYTPQGNDTLASYTACSFPGYANQALAPLGAPFVVSGQAISNGGINSWAWGGGPGSQTIQGYAVYDATTGDVQFAEQLATPFVISAGSGPFNLTVTLTEQSQL